MSVMQFAFWEDETPCRSEDCWAASALAEAFRTEVSTEGEYDVRLLLLLFLLTLLMLALLLLGTSGDAGGRDSAREVISGR